MTRRRFFLSMLTALVASAHPSAQGPTLTQVASLAVPADLVQVHGQHAYVIGQKTLSILDISNPSAPVRAGVYTFPDRIWGFTLADSLLYAAVDLAGLHIIDVSNPGAPTARGVFKTKGQAHGVAVSGTRAVVADHMDGLVLIDVSNAARPAPAGSFFLEGYARDVIVTGSMAYAVDSPTGFYAADLSKSGSFETIGAVQTASGRSLAAVGAPRGSTASFVCISGGTAFQVFDVSRPAAPTLVAAMPTPGGRPQRSTTHGALAFIADGAAGVQIVDLSTPARPSIVGSFATARPARDIAVSDSHAVVVVGTDEVLILRRDQR